MIHTHSSLDKLIGNRLAEILSRLDVRSSIVIEENFNSVYQALQQDVPDVLIVIGANFNRKFLKAKKIKSTLLTCFIEQNGTLSQSGKEQKIEGIDLVYRDLPMMADERVQEYVGNPLMDYIKAVKTPAEVGTTNVQLTIIYNRRQKNFIHQLSRRLHNAFTDMKIHVVTTDSELEKSIQKIGDSSVVVAFDNQSELLSLELNCPTIRINSRRIFRKRNEFSLLNFLAKENVIQVFQTNQVDQVQNEITRVIQDHNYCAGIMGDFQVLKSRIGNQPTLRLIAHAVIETVG